MNPIDPSKNCPYSAEEQALCQQMETKCVISNTKTPPQLFIDSLLKNSLFAYTTVPTEGLAVRRIVFMMSAPIAPPPSCLSMLKSITKTEGAKGLAKELFAGHAARVSYCLLGNFTTLQFIQWFGSDISGLCLTAILKNSILPFSLWSNAAQCHYSRSKTIESIWKGCLTPSTHAWFFTRNLVSAVALWPGFWVSDKYYQYSDNSTVAKVYGFSTTLTVAAVANSFVKPFFTAGNFSYSCRWKTACRLPALTIIAIREAVSTLFQFSNREPQKITSKQ